MSCENNEESDAEINACKLLQEILEHQVANLGKPESEFYKCYTYSCGSMPDWVDKAKKLVKQNSAISLKADER